MTDGVIQDEQPVFSLQPLLDAFDYWNERLDRVLEQLDRALVEREQADNDG